MINQKGKKIYHPNSHGGEVKECHVQERLVAINMLSTMFSKFPQPFMVSTSLFLTSLRRITYAWSISSYFRWILISIFNEPWEGVVRSHHVWWVQCYLMILRVLQRCNSTYFSCLEILKKRLKRKLQRLLFVNLFSWVRKGIKQYSGEPFSSTKVFLFRK